MRNFMQALTCVSLFSLVAACDQTPTSEQAAAPAEKATVTVADPKAYTPVDAGALGVNENGKGMPVGEHIAEVTINDVEGKPYAIQKAWSEKPALVIFYRGGWCPFCNAHVHELASKYEQLKTAGVQPILISVDQPDKAAMVEAKYEVPFPLLSDPELVAHEAFNVVLELDAETQKVYKEYGIDLPAWSGQNHNKIAISSAFLVDQKGHVLFSHAPADYRTRPTVEQLLAVIKEKVPAS